MKIIHADIAVLSGVSRRTVAGDNAVGGLIACSTVHTRTHRAVDTFH